VKWKKLGHLFTPYNNHPWMLSHAANTVAEHIEGDQFRVYFACRDDKNRSHVGSCALNLSTLKICDIASEPILTPGDRGHFDEDGATICWLVHFQGRTLMYYVGWNLKVSSPWLNAIGLAEFNKTTQRFEKASGAPVMDRSVEDPRALSYPSVVEDMGILRMWYGTNLRWGDELLDMRYSVKTASSPDGIHWNRTNHIALELGQHETAIARPCVLKTATGFEMFYSYRGHAPMNTNYRIGYATSTNGENWVRKDSEMDIDVSLSGWDSEMICYPFVFDHAGSRYMLYNGNRYGATGFGIAILDC
jgi:hypothetical protein